MTGRETPSPDPVPHLLEEAGIAGDPALVHAVRSIAALGDRPAPDASAELAQLMADGGSAPRSRRNKRRITFIGGALAVSMGAGMSGVAAGTLHFRDGFDDAVVSITRFTVRNDADRAEPAPGPLADGAKGHAPAASGVPAPATAPPAPAPAARVDASASPGSAPAPVSSGADVAPAAPTVPPAAPAARAPVLPVAPAVGAPGVPQPRPIPVPVTPGAGVAPGATGPDRATTGQGGTGQRVPGQTNPGRPTPIRPAQDRSVPVGAGQDGPGQDRPGAVRPGRGQEGSVPTESTGTDPDTVPGDAPAPADYRISWLRAPASPVDASFFLDAPIALDAEWFALFVADGVSDAEYPAPEPPVEPVLDAPLPDDAAPELPVESAPDEPFTAPAAEELPTAPAAEEPPPGSTDDVPVPGDTPPAATDPADPVAVPSHQHPR